jgi:chromate transport protein ChrA
MEDKTTPPQPLPYNNQLPTTSVQQSLPETNSNNTAAIPAISHSKKKSLIVLGIRLFLILICLVFIYIYLTSTLSSMISSLIIFILGLVIIFTPKLFKKHNNSTKNYVLSIIYFFCLLVIIIGLLPIKFNQSSKFIEKKLFNSYSSIDFQNLEGHQALQVLMITNFIIL